MYIEILAAAVRQNTDMKAIQIGKETHKVAFYAYDIIAYLTSPGETIHEFMKIIAEYGKVSGYTLNRSKCESLIGRQPSQALKECYSFKWENKRVKYTGNHCALITKLRQDMSRWGIMPHSLLSRVETIKMMVLPQFLFLFQTLAIVVPEKYFKNCNRIISNCIWNNKKQRIKFKTLCEPKEEGGLGLPNLQGYFLAQLLAIMKWTERETESKWITIEKNAMEKLYRAELLH